MEKSFVDVYGTLDYLLDLGDDTGAVVNHACDKAVVKIAHGDRD